MSSLDLGDHRLGAGPCRETIFDKGLFRDLPAPDEFPAPEIGDALAAAWPRMQLVGEYENLKIECMNSALYNGLLNAAFPCRSRDYRDWYHYVDAPRFKDSGRRCSCCAVHAYRCANTTTGDPLT